MTPFFRDVRYALRTLARSPAFTIAAVLALSLAIGANTAVFSVVKALLSFPIPLEEPDRVAFLYGENPEQGIRQGGMSADDYLDFRDELGSFSYLTSVTVRPYNVVGAGEPVRVDGAQVTPGFFDVAGITLAQGRSFLEEEGAPGGARVAIVSHGFWQQALGGNPDVIGQTLELDGEVYDVVGVTPETFFFPQPTTQLWTPLVLERGAAARDERQLYAIGRLADGATARAATAEARAVAERLAATYPDSNRGWTATVQTIPESFRQGSGLAVTLLYSAITFVLLIACVNVTNLILARSLARERELALRSSFGASRRRLVAQLLTESVVLALLGGGTGFLAGIWGIRVLRNWLAPDPNVGFIARYMEMDGRVALHAAAISILAGLLFGLLPAFKVTRGDLVAVLKEGGRGGESRDRRRLRGVLVTAEVALALALLVTAGTLIRAFNSIYAADPGLDPSNLLTLELALPEHGYPEDRQVARFFDDALAAVRAIPGVTSAATTTVLPLVQFPTPGTARAVVEGQAGEERDETPNVVDVAVSPDYFETMRIALRRGRTFDARDREDGEPVAVVTESFVERFLAGGDATDQRLRLRAPGNRGRSDDEAGVSRRIVGVVANHDSHSHSVRRPKPPPVVFVPHDQVPRRAATVVLRTSGPPLELAAAARDAVWQIDPALPIDKVRTLEQAEAAVDTQNRFFLKVLTGLALAALILAAVGIYGIIAYSVNQRTREIGIRSALGARPVHAVGVVARQAALLTAVGIAVGCGLAWLFVRFMASQLAGIAQTSAGGPLTFVAVVVFFVVVALAASAVPAARAVRLDPVQALREE